MGGGGYVASLYIQPRQEVGKIGRAVSKVDSKVLFKTTVAFKTSCVVSKAF